MGVVLDNDIINLLQHFVLRRILLQVFVSILFLTLTLVKDMALACESTHALKVFALTLRKDLYICCQSPRPLFIAGKSLCLGMMLSSNSELTRYSTYALSGRLKLTSVPT